MNFSTILFAFIGMPSAVFSQTAYKKTFPEHKVNVRKATNYYLEKNIDQSPGFPVQYSSLFSGLMRYTKYDTIRANKIINRLYWFNDILFYRLMRIRLQWEFKQHIVKAPLDSVVPLLKSKIDSAKYFYMLALYFQDTMSERLARNYSYIKVTRQGNEVVDWVKMKYTKWGDPMSIPSGCMGFTLPNDDDYDRQKFQLRDTAIRYYKKAIDNDPTEFHYLKELILYMSNSPKVKDEEIKQLIISKLPNYTDKEKKAEKISGWF